MDTSRAPAVPRWAFVVPGALVVALTVPYLVAGPGFFLDDWFALRNARLDGWWQAAGSDQWSARPGAGVTYALSFGLLGDRAALHVLVATAVLAACATLLAVIARRFLPTAPALGLAAVWALVPNTSSIEMWPSALNIAVSLLAALIAVERLTTRAPTVASDVAFGVAGATSLLTYEATGPVLVGAAVAVGIGRSAADRRRLALVTVGALGAALVWLVAFIHPGKQGLDRWLDVGAVVPGHIGDSAFGSSPLGQVATLLVVVGVVVLAVAARRPVFGLEPAWEPRLLAAGAAVLVLGLVPFLRYLYAPLGLGDRVTVVSGIGGAMVLVAVLGLAWRGHVAVGVACTLIVVVAAGLARVDTVDTYATAADDGRRFLAVLDERFPDVPDRVITVGPRPVQHRNVSPFWNPEWVAVWHYGTRDARFVMSFDEARFATVAPADRIDVFELFELPPTQVVGG